MKYSQTSHTCLYIEKPCFSSTVIPAGPADSTQYMQKTFSWCFKSENMKEDAKKKYVTAMKAEGIVRQ